jgi:DNA polymerase-3 subunit gamma/tau
VFYLKYRPKTFEEIDNLRVQESMVDLLKNKEIPHAYLFIGQKGTGKTSTARIFAKSINCLKPDGVNPCNHCANCLAITNSSSPDVIELDAASNRGINEIKSLIKEASFVPMTCRYRVFIVDEAHMITSDGFNALLKTLEEPPPSVIFILATTNPEKVPKTISSRCFIVNFGRAKKAEIERMLKRITVQEKIKVEEKVYTLIIEHADNSFRDAAKIFEELTLQNKLEFEEAQQYLGVRSKNDLLEVIDKQSLKAALLWIEEFTQSGGNVKNLLEQLQAELHLALLAKNSILIEDGPNIKFSLKEISLLIKLFNEAYFALHNTPIEVLPLEIALIEFYNLRKKTSS